jgi:hypothetical protein
LFPLENTNTLPISAEDGAVSMEMLNDYYKYFKAINAKGHLPTESVIMALLLSQHELIEWLEIHLLVLSARIQILNHVSKLQFFTLPK